jgi:hypothetical protein
LEEGHGAALGLVVLHGQVDEAGGAVDGDIQVALAALAILGAQLGQVLHVHMHEAEVIRLEAAMRSAGAIRRRQAAQALGFQDAVDRVAIEMRQEVRDHKGEVIQRKAGGPPQRAHKGPLFRPWPSRAACAAGWSGPDSPPDRADATCGSSRSRRYSAEPGLRLAPVIEQSQPGRQGWCGRWHGPRALAPPGLR